MSIREFVIWYQQISSYGSPSPVQLQRAVQTTGTSHQFATEADPRAHTSMSVIHTPAIVISDQSPDHGIGANL